MFMEMRAQEIMQMYDAAFTKEAVQTDLRTQLKC
jgi:hypothetical protein